MKALSALIVLNLSFWFGIWLGKIWTKYNRSLRNKKLKNIEKDMREIRFRAWDKERKEWQYFTLLQLAQGEASLIWAKLENWGQFTGLKDKNGKEIYESDLVVWGGQKNPVEVVWKEQGFQPTINITTEVVGNKYEGLQNSNKGDIM